MASIGAMLAARRAGDRQAMTPTNSRAAAVIPSVHGSRSAMPSTGLSAKNRTDAT